jgi:hypothetical protein
VCSSDLVGFWGTTRTLTIGQTGKSVDGGSNVSWTLAEIGGVTSSSAYTWSAAQTFNGGVTASVLDVTGAARFNGNVNLGNDSADIITVAGGATFSRTLNVVDATRLNGGVTASTLDVTGTSRFTGIASFIGGITVGIINAASIRGNGSLPFVVDPPVGSLGSEGSLRFSSLGLPTRYSTLTTASLSADRTIILPNEDGTVALRGANTFTGLQTLTAGLSAAGGITFNGAITGATATFTKIVNANAGINTTTVNTNIISANSVSGESQQIKSFNGSIVLDAPTDGFKGGGGYIYIGDVDAVGNSTRISVDDENQSVDLYANGSIGLYGPISGYNADFGILQTPSNGPSVIGRNGVAIGAGAISAKTSGYTLTAADNGKVVTFNSASALVCGIGTASGATGFSCTIIQLGTGGVRFASSGVTLNSFNGLTLAGQHASASVVCYQTNVLNVSGNLIG